ncbi:MAG TPA: LCP family protein [Candidatus Limnocylindrales bacterium]|nr:LCP family protein [Candidatus Limnocylindrales bacterium]
MAEPSVRDPSAPPLRARRPTAADHARPMRSQRRSIEVDQGDPTGSPSSRAHGAQPAQGARPDSRPTDRRRLLAAIASSLLPGFGQAINGRLRSALLFGLPTLAVIGMAWLTAQSDRPTMLIARVIAPSVLGVLLVVNVVILGWRAVAVLHAFLDRRYPLRPGRLGAMGLAVLLVATAVPHLLAWSYGTAAQAMFGQIFSGSAVRSISSAPPPAEGERLNVLLIGVDSAPGRTEALTDSMIVVSLDPVGRTVSMVSIPRDLASVPLGNGSIFGPKLNSLMSWADRHPKDVERGGIRALEDAIGALFGIPIHYYAKVDLGGFAAMIDAVGGVDIVVRKALDDPRYPGLDGKRGWSVQPGPHHFDGTDALAYARIRKSAGESDLTRAARQQEVLVALRNRAVGAGILISLPKLLHAVGATVRTDLPPDRLPELAALAEQIGGSSTMKLVLGSPQIRGASSQYGSIFVPVPARIREMAKVVFGPPGADPTWPVASPGSSSAAGASAAP